MKTVVLRRIVAGIFLFLGSIFFYLQVIKGPSYYYLSKKNCIRVVPLAASRGTIYDRNGIAIAYDQLTFDICMIPKDAKDPGLVMARLSALSGIDIEAIRLNYKKNLLNPFTPVVLIKNAGFSLVGKVEEQSSDLPGVVTWPVPQRTYPYQEAVGHCVGYLGKISPEEMSALSEYGYTIRDWVGKQGMERIFDRYLKGKDGGMLVEVNNAGKMTKLLGLKYPRKGQDITATIDMRVQMLLYELLAQHRGAGIVYDVNNGEVVAIVSAPSFDPNLFIQKKKGAQSLIQKLLQDKRRVFLNRAVAGTYPPGSVFKPVVVLAALEQHAISADTSFNCPGVYERGGRKFYCWNREGHGPVTVVEALQYSCNVFFYHTALKTGASSIADYSWKFGFGKVTGIGFPEEKRGTVPTAKWKKAVLRDSWYEGDTINYGIGQGYLLATPAQICGMFAAIANNGFIIHPHIIKKIDAVTVTAPKPQKLSIDARALALVKEGLVRVVSAPDGTGKAARTDHVEVAGKTGSAQRKGRNSDAWFACYFPARAPRFAVAILVEEGGAGGNIPASIAKKLIEGMRENHLL